MINSNKSKKFKLCGAQFSNFSTVLYKYFCTYIYLNVYSLLL